MFTGGAWLYASNLEKDPREDAEGPVHVVAGGAWLYATNREKDPRGDAEGPVGEGDGSSLG